MQQLSGPQAVGTIASAAAVGAADGQAAGTPCMVNDQVLWGWALAQLWRALAADGLWLWMVDGLRPALDVLRPLGRVVPSQARSSLAQVKFCSSLSSHPLTPPTSSHPQLTFPAGPFTLKLDDRGFLSYS